MPIDINEGLKHESSIHCDELVSLLKSVLTNYVGTLSTQKLQALDRALRVALDLHDESPIN
jgi:mRNA interferase MazF